MTTTGFGNGKESQRMSLSAVWMWSPAGSRALGQGMKKVFLPTGFIPLAMAALSNTQSPGLKAVSRVPVSSPVWFVGCSCCRLGMHT